MQKKRFLSLILSLLMVCSILMMNSQAIEAQAASTPNRVVGYFPSYRMYKIDSIDFSAMTHCILAFMTYKDGTLTSNFSDQDMQTVLAKCHANNVKVLIGIGGWDGFDASDDPFGSAEKRTEFVSQLMSYVNKYNLDGVDIDIELKDTCIWNNFDPLIAELSACLKSENKLLTMAVSRWFTNYMMDSTFRYFDFINLMAYDYDMSGNGEVAPWSHVYDMVSHYQSRGVSNDKLVIGVPFYGYGSGGIAYSYGEVVEMNPENAYLSYANGIYYNGMNTIREKAEYSKSFGGIMIWEVSQDSFGTYSLLNVIKEVMKGESDDTPEDVPSGDTSTNEPGADTPTTDDSITGDSTTDDSTTDTPTDEDSSTGNQKPNKNKADKVKPNKNKKNK